MTPLDDPDDRLLATDIVPALGRLAHRSVRLPATGLGGLSPASWDARRPAVEAAILRSGP